MIGKLARVESHFDFLFSDHDVCRHVDRNAEELPSLALGETSQALDEPPMQPAGDHESEAECVALILNHCNHSSSRPLAYRQD